jgi:hypothetical protein
VGKTADQIPRARIKQAATLQAQTRPSFLPKKIFFTYILFVRLIYILATCQGAGVRLTPYGANKMESQLEVQSNVTVNNQTSARLYQEVDNRPIHIDKVEEQLEPTETALEKLNRVHVVTKGEGLWSIARQSLQEEGNDENNPHEIRAKMKEIVKLNEDRFPNLGKTPHRIYEDQWLLVRPAKNHLDEHETEQFAKHHQEKVDKPQEIQEVKWITAKAGQKVHAEEGDKVIAEKDSKVIAHPGSQVRALNDSFVMALPGSKVEAFHASTVANYGGQIQAWSGANIFELGSISIPEKN